MQELVGMMEYVEKLAGSAAETSFMTGAEYSSFSLSEILVNAQRQVGHDKLLSCWVEKCWTENLKHYQIYVFFEYILFINLANKEC